MTQISFTQTATYPKLHTLDEVIEACGAHPLIQPYARIVGQWVWVEFPCKPHVEARDFLKGSGFRWNQTRNAWQHNCGHFTRANRRIDPRAVYGQATISGDYVTREQSGAPDRIAQELNNFQVA